MAPPKGAILFEGSYLPGKQGPPSAICARWQGQWRFESGSASRARTFSYVQSAWHPACAGFRMARMGPTLGHTDAAGISPVFWGYSGEREGAADAATAAATKASASASAPVDAAAASNATTAAAGPGEGCESTWSGFFTVKGKRGESFQVNDIFTLRINADASVEGVPVTGHGSNYYGRFELVGTLRTVDGAWQLACKRHYVVAKRPKQVKKKDPAGPADALDAPVRASKRTRVATKFDKDLGAASFTKPRTVHDHSASAGSGHTNGNSAASNGAGSAAGGSCAAEGAEGDATGRSSSSGSTRHPRGRARPRKGEAGLGGGAGEHSHDGGRGAGRGRAGDKAAGASRGKVIWFDAHADEKGDTYEGEYMDGLRHGWGTCVLPNGHMYEGEWSEGVEHGFGVISGAKNDILFEGEFCEGHFYGCGTYYFTPPRKGEPYEYYEGEWKDGMRHGHGVYTEADGTCYTGEWRGDGRCGRGRLACADGSWYEGEWQHDGRHGHGVLHLRDGFRYEGNFKDDMMEGRGSCRYPDGSCYEGMWRAGKKDGRGTLKFVNGACYEGRFRDDKMDGTGTLTMPRSCIMHMETNSADKWTALIPIEFQSDVQRMHLKAGFDQEGM